MKQSDTSPLGGMAPILILAADIGSMAACRAVRGRRSAPWRSVPPPGRSPRYPPRPPERPASPGSAPSLPAASAIAWTSVVLSFGAVTAVTLIGPALR